MRALRTMNVRRVLSLIAGVLVLAAVILGLSALLPSGQKSDSGDSDEQAAAFLSAKAADALRSGDETAALAFAARALVVDAGNAEARRITDQVNRRRASKKADPVKPPGSSPDASATPPPANGVDPAFLTVIPNIQELLPKTFSGFSLGGVVALEGGASVSGMPVSSSGVTRVLWAIHDGKTVEGASAFIENTSKESYGSDASSVVIDGASAYFGTDGTRYATVVYSRGRYVFEALVSGDDGAPAGYRATVVSAAKAFADRPVP